VFTTDASDGALRAAVEVRSHPRCLEHVPGLGHPERPERLAAVLEALVPPAGAPWTVDAASPLPPEDDILGVLKWIHDPEHIERVREASAIGSGWLDSHDCAVSHGTYRAAMAAAGLGLQAGLDLVNRRLERSFVVARPPSHHAERTRARGYCFFNTAALAAEVVVRSWNQTVLIVDFDAFHGNGTQSHLWDRGEVGYLSVHRYPFFPGSGTANEIGEGPGRGAIRNIPLAAGADDEVFCSAFEHGLEEIAGALQPSALVVAAGFNAHMADATGGMKVSTDGFRRLTRAVVTAADRWAGGRVLSFLEGGYELEALARSARAHVEELAGVNDPSAGGRLAVN
jgi:acetoin utilization deacetylase AcuC-like enzyme